MMMSLELETLLRNVLTLFQIAQVTRRSDDYSNGWLAPKDAMGFHVYSGQGNHHGNHCLFLAASRARLSGFACRKTCKKIRRDAGLSGGLGIENGGPPLSRNTVALPPLRNGGSTGANVGRHGLA
jgi:hypothetical protein